MGLRTYIILLCCAGIYIQFAKAGAASYLGCFKDDQDRMFDYYGGSMTVDMCISYCGNNHHVYSGLQDTNKCYCGDSYPNRSRYPRVLSEKCSETCSGWWKWESCGTNWGQSVYRDCSILSLPHCKELRCDSTYNKWCTKCSDKLLYKVKQQRCHETCSWVHRWCWPGNCPDDFTSSCNCMQGFRTVKNNSTYARCQPMLQPSIESCQARAFGRKGSGEAWSHVGSSECSLQKDFYGRFQVAQFSVALKANFIVNIEDKYKKNRPGFVKEEQFGVTDVDVLLQKVPLTGSRTNVGRELVKTDIQSKNPTRDFENDNVNISNRANLSDGEKLCLVYNIYGGGFLVSKNMISLTESNIPYEKTKQSKEICYIYDRMLPVHCIQTGSCLSRDHDPLKLSRRLTKSKLLTVNIEGWFDPYPTNGHQLLASGIETFEINIYEVIESTNTTLMRDTKTVGNYTLEPNATEVEITLPDKNPMLYVIFLDVKDRANNVRQARRFVLFDQSSVILTNNRKPFSVTSASTKSNLKWQVYNEKLCFSWKGRFYNNGCKNNNWLRPVKLEDRIHGKYDQIDGPLSVNGTQNVNGVTGYEYTLEKNNINTELYGIVTNFLSESICLAADLTDGDMFTFTLQAMDIMNHTLNDSVSVNIDTSVPEITDVWLVRDGQEQLFVHHSSDLSLMSVRFKSFDIHSGLREVKWAFGVYENRTVLIEKPVPVTATAKTDMCLNHTDCYCPIIGNCTMTTYTANLTKLRSKNMHEGTHNKRYFFTIKVINTAYLVAIEHIDILVDESPPEVGMVLEGPMGSPDIDYTSSDDITVHWHGFIDHESGIKFYRIAIGRECMHNLKNILPGQYNNSIIQESVHDSANIVFPDGEGQYFATVIAYNHALSPSKPVCSDGITLDKSIPNVTNIIVKYAKIVESIGCFDGKPWLVGEDVSKRKLGGEACLQRCKNETNDNILGVLPEILDIKINTSDIFSFLCTSLERFRGNTIFAPSDLFEISWNITEDHSQIANVYIGFGKDVTALDSPDLISYVQIHHLTKYIQRHPGLIGEETVYAFIMVQNRAGLDRKVWFGPILADETAPICPPTIQTMIENGNLVIKWTSKIIFDTEQKETIGKIMFRLGFENKYISPFLEWNIKYHGGQCGVEYQCIRYPIQRLQKYDSPLGGLFFAQLHVYNYAGHYCSVKTVPIGLPSLLPPASGIVLDLYPDALPPYRDTDVVFNSTKLCFVWKGFHHHDDVHLQVGLGNGKNIDNVVPFHTIAGKEQTLICEQLVNVTQNEKYFVTIKASCSGGTTSVPSNGFTILNATDVSSSLKVFHGTIGDSTNEIKIKEIRTKVHNFRELYLSNQLIPGTVYSLKIFSNSNQSVEISNRQVYVKRVYTTPIHNTLTIIPLDSINQLTIKLNNGIADSSDNLNIHLYKCDSDMLIQSSTSLLPVHWSLPRRYTEFVTHYEVGICPILTDKKHCSTQMVFILNGNQTIKKFHGHFKEGFYQAAVRPCFGKTCLPPIWSKGVKIENILTDTALKEATGRIEISCLNTTITLNKLACTASDNTDFPIGYRWTIFSDERGQHMMSKWKVVTQTDNVTSLQDSECFLLPVYYLKQLYTCVESFCLSGASHHTCHSINIKTDPNHYDKNVLYDLNLNDPFAKTIEQYKYSLNIGDNLGKLHSSEMDFAAHNSQIGGFLIGQVDATIEWYLMTTRQIPNGRCTLDPSCLVTKNTTSGFVDFGNTRLKENGMFYLCANVHQTRHFHSITVCSDGFLIDESLPEKGVVVVESTNGYLIEGSEMTLRWSGFHGNHKAEIIGYPSDIAYYQYAVGTHPGSDDIAEFTSAGLSKIKSIRHLHLRPGQVYYVTIRAFNHVNTSVDGYSTPVIYDNTPPTVGMLEIKGGGMKRFVTTNHILLEWSDIDDDESGIRKIEIGIGSSNGSSDIVQFAEFVNYAEINSNERFQDGHEYCGILRATNGAGLSSYTVSSPFVIDSTPPEIGHVMDVLPSLDFNQHDIDYQTETNSITSSWFGFHDSHSYITRYKVGLGTSPGDDNIISFTDVGLQTFKTWNSSFHQGVKYFSTVISCNGAGLCSRATSNGVIIDNSGPIPGLVVVGDPGRHTRYLSNTKTLHASWIGFEDPHTGIDGFEVCVGTSLGRCDVMERWNVSLSSSFIRSNLNMTMGAHMFVTVRACNKVNICTQRSSPSFIVDNTPPYLVKRPHIESLHQAISASTSRQIISDPSFFKVLWEFKDDESPVIRTSITIYSKLDSHVPIQELVLSNENKVAVHLSKSDILRQGDVYKVRVTACNAASLCKTALSDEILIDYTPPQLGGLMPPLQYEVQNGGQKQLLLNLTWYGFVDSESDIRSYYVTVGYTYSGSELIYSYGIVPDTSSENNAQQSQVSVSIPKLLPDTLVLTIWAENNAGLNTTGAKVTTTTLSTSKDRSKGDLIIQKHSCKSDFCNNDCTCAAIGKQCKVVSNISCTNITGHSKGGVIVNLTLNTDNKIKKIIGSSKCIGSDWSYSNQDSKVLRFEYSFGIHGENVGQGVFNVSIENPWHDVGQRTQAFYCLSKEYQLMHNTHYVAYVRAWVSFTEYVIFESPAVIVDHSPPDIHKKHFVIDTWSSCDEDVDYLVSDKSISACWDGVFSDDESGITKFFVSLGTSPSIDDAIQFQDVGNATRIDWTGQSFEPGTRYYTTVRAVNSIGLQTEVSSDGIVHDDSPPVVGVVYNTGHHNDIIYQSVFEPVEFSWHGFDDEHSFIDSYTIAYVVNDEKLSENESMVFTDIGLSNSVLYTGQVEHKSKIIALLKAVDKAGHASAIVMSRSLYIDATPPASFLCAKFATIEHQDITNIHKDEFVWSQTIPSQLHDILKIEVVVRDIRLGFRAYLTIDDLFMVLPFVVNADGSVISEYTYLSHEQRTRNISVHVYDIKPYTKMVAKILKCSKFTIVTNGTGEIMAQQISPDIVSICVPAIDLESGIKLISTGIGSILDGLEIQSLRSASSSLHDVIQGNFTHGMQVFIKAEIENHAGLKSVLRSNVLIIDHTAPLLKNINGLIKYLSANNKTVVTVKSTWKSLDQESNIKYCEYCIGLSDASCDVIYWTRTTSFTVLESPTFHANHGSRVYGIVRCINAVQLTGHAYFGPLVVSYLPPQSVDSNIEFITDKGVNQVTQSDSDSLTLRWSEFKDVSQLQTYSVQVSYGDSVSQSWQEIGSKNYLKISHLNMVSGGSYGVTIRGKNIGGVESHPINNSITIDSIKPKVTDIPISIRHLLDNEFVISWTNLFTSAGTIESYDVSIGSLEDSTDILMPTSTSRDNIIIYIPDNFKKLYFVVMAFSQSGLSEIYRQNIIVG